MLFISLSFAFRTTLSSETDKIQNGYDNDYGADQPHDAVHGCLLCFSAG